jgi:hypothetical protein
VCIVDLTVSCVLTRSRRQRQGTDDVRFVAASGMTIVAAIGLKRDDQVD